jgi:2-polyprenyl-6-methoxyphenol hydroxylase-like FAD-dependent oxidoreductase
MTQSSYSVLIVGAGPTGMELAAELQRHGICFLIIDKRPSHVTTSNAAGIHARTLECWHKRPWSSLIHHNGLQMSGVNISAKDVPLMQLDFTQLVNTEYPYILSLPQNQTETILDDYLTQINCSVKRDTTLTNIKHKEKSIIATMVTSAGIADEIEVDWVVGCDGYKSTVRELTDISFAGTDIEEKFLLIDAEMDADYAQDHFHIYLDQKGLLAFFKMKNSTRIIAGVGHDSEFKKINEPSINEITRIIKQRSNITFQIKNIVWKSHFWIHECIAQTFQKKRIFIAGDAAHVHSPAGGQGMNTGIQDAYNIAWKLAYVIKGLSREELLQSYELERRPIAKRVVGMTTVMTHFANLSHPWAIKLRNTVMPLLARQLFLQKMFLGRMSELSLSYNKNSPIINGKRLALFSPGQRAPDVLVDTKTKTYLYDWLIDTKHHLFVFHASTVIKEPLLELQKNYDRQLSVHLIEPGDVIEKIYTFKKMTFCLIRPDQYIGFLGDSIKELEKYMAKLFYKK